MTEAELIKTTVEYWLKWGFGIVALLMGIAIKHLYSKFKKEKAAREALTRGVLSLMRDNLKALHHECVSQNCCPLHIRDRFNAQYKDYTDLGGNGSVPGMYEEINHLPYGPESGDK